MVVKCKKAKPHFILYVSYLRTSKHWQKQKVAWKCIKLRLTEIDPQVWLTSILVCRPNIPDISWTRLVTCYLFCKLIEIRVIISNRKLDCACIFPEKTYWMMKCFGKVRCAHEKERRHPRRKCRFLYAYVELVKNEDASPTSRPINIIFCV